MSEELPARSTVLDWDKVLAATDEHKIDSIDTRLDGRQSWTYIRCTCGNEPDREAFTEPWEFTDHIRRLVFEALTDTMTDGPLRDHDICVPHEHVETDMARWKRDQAASLLVAVGLGGASAGRGAAGAGSPAASEYARIVGPPKESVLFPEIATTQPDNGFHRGNPADGKHYWLTPPDLYARLDAEFHFDFDPCPYPLPDGFDGLTCDWGQSNYVNPPFGSIIHEGKVKGPTAWARKAIAEHRKGKTVVFVYPMHKWRLMLLDEMGSGVRNLGDVRWLATEDGSSGKGTGEHIACFVLLGRSTERNEVAT